MEENYQPLQTAIQQKLAACATSDRLKSQVQTAIGEVVSAYFADIYKEIDQLQAVAKSEIPGMEQAISTMSQGVETSLGECGNTVMRLHHAIDRVKKESAFDLSSEDENSLASSERRLQNIRDVVYKSADYILPITVQTIEACETGLRVQLLNTQAYTIYNAKLNVKAEGTKEIFKEFSGLKGAESKSVECPTPPGARKVSVYVSIANKMASRTHEFTL